MKLLKEIFDAQMLNMSIMGAIFIVANEIVGFEITVLVALALINSKLKN